MLNHKPANNLKANLEFTSVTTLPIDPAIEDSTDSIPAKIAITPAQIAHFAHRGKCQLESAYIVGLL